MKAILNPPSKYTFARGFLAFLCSAMLFVLLAGNAEATPSYRHMCKKCEVSVVDKRKTGPAKVKCSKGGFHVWKNIKVDK
ncbi:MAG: hypothetical protein DELT_01690 [Desulfovibrio sp.]